jgi:carbamoyl-phosphate synthase large subunit
LREEGYRVILANSNPATIMTDPDFADRTYIEPLTPDVLLAIIERECPDAVLPTLGGQTALNLAMALHERGEVGVPGKPELIGANAEAIATAEDRDKFKRAMIEIGLKVPRSGVAHSMDEAEKVIAEIGLPVIIRPAYILGGRGTGIAHNPDEFRRVFGSKPDFRSTYRVVDRRLEGVRARSHARSRRQLRDHLLYREC